MPNTDFQILKVPDRELIESLLKIHTELDISPSGRLVIYLASGRARNDISIDEIDNDPFIEQLRDWNRSLIWRISLDIGQFLSASVSVERSNGFDQASVSFDDHSDQVQVVRLLGVTQKHLRPFVRTPELDDLLGPELAEFYTKREEALLRLEGVSQKLIEQNEEYRRGLDAKADSSQQQLEEKIKEKEQDLEAEYKKKEELLDRRAQEIIKKEELFDEKDNQQARRTLRAEFKQLIADRTTDYSLSDSTVRKRLPINLVFLGILSVLGCFVYTAFLGSLPSTADWYDHARLPISLVAFVGMAIFYIRWLDGWSQRHADEEFRLKQLDIDIDRASWVVEMALEWKEEKGTEIPQELIDRLTRNLFREARNKDDVRHPTEDILSTFLGEATKLRLGAPGIAEAEFDRRGLKRAKKAVAPNIREDQSE